MRREYDFSKAKRGAAVKAERKTRIAIGPDDDILEANRTKGDVLGRGQGAADG